MNSECDYCCERSANSESGLVYIVYIVDVDIRVYMAFYATVNEFILSQIICKGVSVHLHIIWHNINSFTVA